MATLKTWMTERNGQTVSTLQTDKRTGRTWQPGARMVDATRATYVTLDGSRRDYAGLRVQHSTAHTLTVSDNWHVITYYDGDANLDTVRAIFDAQHG